MLGGKKKYNGNNISKNKKMNLMGGKYVSRFSKEYTLYDVFYPAINDERIAHMIIESGGDNVKKGFDMLKKIRKRRKSERLEFIKKEKEFSLELKKKKVNKL